MADMAPVLLLDGDSYKRARKGGKVGKRRESMSQAHPVHPKHKSADFQVPTAGPPPTATPPLTQEDFARHWGFASFLEMFEASKPVGAADGKKKWLLTALRGGKWLLWNDGELHAARVFDSREEALPQVPKSSPPTNSEAAKHQA